MEVPRGNISTATNLGFEKLDKHIKDWHKIWIAFKAVARESIKHNGHIAVEWPSGCDYWRYHIVQEFFAELQLEKIKFDGCALGLRSDSNDPIRKPWSVATNNGHIFRAFAKYTCPGKDKHPYHEPCAGKYTKRTENYTWPFTDVIHKAWRDSHLEIQRGIESCEARYFRKLNRKTIPAMPCRTVTETSTETPITTHRPRSEHHPVYNAMVARLLTSKEVQSNPKALQAILEEGEKLLKQGVWDITSVRERRDVIQEATRLNKKVHFARIFPICSEKGSELPEGDPDRKYKGRCVVQGNDVRDENSHAAIFQELSSSPATLEAAKSVDAYGAIEGNDTQQCDAQQAYVQTELGGVETWISLPKILRPASWAGYKDPVCILKLALYGHPDAGGYWERHCDEHLTSVGYVPVPDWRSTYWHPDLKLLLMVYVDDFKMSGPSANFEKGWSLIRQKIKTDEPHAVTKCLGCEHLIRDTNVGGVSVKQMEYNMRPFFEQCVESYLTLTKKTIDTLKPAKTPFLDETKLENTPEDSKDGLLQPIACKVLMKILYGARLARFDLLRPIAALASKITKWDSVCDRMLHRLVCYINSSLDYKLKGHIGDKMEDLNLTLYSDADFAGCLDTAKSTSGVFIALTGPNSFFPLNAISKKQSCVSHSTPEAEIVAADLAIRTEGLPALQLWDMVLGRPVKLLFQEDNQATIQILKTQKNPTLRHLNRTHRVNISWLCEVFRNLKEVELTYCKTDAMAADIFTKAFTNPIKWQAALDLIGITHI